MKSLAIIKFYGKKYTMNKALIDINYLHWLSTTPLSIWFTHS